MAKLVKTSIIAACALCAASPLSAEIVSSQGGGFASAHDITVAAGAAQSWAMLVQPELWWTHSWSDNSANLSLEAAAGGCFCETIPGAAGEAAGSAEHMRVVMVMPGRMLRMTGALGPLQSEGLSGTLTVTLTAVDAGTRINWDYVIGGQSRLPLDALAPVVDSVQAEFLGSLADALGGPV